MKKILICLFLLLICINVKAHENDYFKINIPENFKQTINENNMYKWTKNNDYIAITISNNKDYNTESFSDKELKEQQEYLEKGINEGLSKYKITATVSNIKKITSDKYTFIDYDIYYPSKSSTGYDTYQKGRMYTTSSYIYTVIYSSDTSLDKNTEYLKILDSIELLDLSINNAKLITTKVYLIIFLIIVFIAALIIFFKINKKHQ